MTYEIHQSLLTPELKNKIHEIFSKSAIDATGINGLSGDPISFEVRQGEDFIGCVVVQIFWGQLHIKYLVVEKQYRGQGIATSLMNRAFEFGKSKGCSFAFVETMSFQAPTFYQRLGFNVDFSRHSYDKETSFHYLSKDLHDKTFSRIEIRPFVKSDTLVIVSCFSAHKNPKPQSTFDMYFSQQEAGDRLVWVAYCEDQFAGYCTLKWQSDYESFREQGIPEIKDLNVLPPFRCKGIGSKLLETVENEAFKKGNTVGIGAGLYEGSCYPSLCVRGVEE